MKPLIAVALLIALTMNLMGMNNGGHNPKVQNFTFPTKKILRAIPFFPKEDAPPERPLNTRVFQVETADISIDYNIRNAEVYRPWIVDKHLKGKLEGKAQLIKDVAEENGISPYFLTAICIHESANGLSNVANKKNNVTGIYDGSKRTSKTFDDVDECIRYTGKLLNKPLYRKCRTINDIKKIYSPDFADNDPKNTNIFWSKDVVTWMKKISENELQVKKFKQERI
jgi:beta-N-acetylglucosaminidase